MSLITSIRSTALRTRVREAGWQRNIERMQMPASVTNERDETDRFVYHRAANQKHENAQRLPPQTASAVRLSHHASILGSISSCCFVIPAKQLENLSR